MQMCLTLMHSETLEDHDLCLKSYKELEDWSKKEGVEGFVKTAGGFIEFALKH